MFCSKCGSSLNANGTCPICDTPVSTPAYTYRAPKVSDPGKGLGIASMAVGIASLVTGGGVGIVGLILSTIAKKKSAAMGFTNGFAKAGFITSLISVIYSALAILAVIAYYIFIIVLYAGVLGAAYSSY